MNTQQKLKIIFLSNAYGNFTKVNDLYTKISTKSGDVDVMILIGEVFNQAEKFSALNLLSNLKCKIIIFDSSSISSVLKAKINYSPYEYSSNITILGRSGIFEFKGLKIGYLNGYEDNKFLTKEKKLYTGDAFSYYDIEKFIDKTKIENDKIDILLLSSIPQVFAHELESDFSSPFHNEDVKISTKQILNKKTSYACNILVSNLNPRYIITSVDDYYYERKPFINVNKYLSRYINIAHFNNKVNQKEKFVYAISTIPISKMTKADIDAIDNLQSPQYSLSPFESAIPSSIEEIIQYREKYNLQNIKITKDELYLCNLDHYLTYEELHDFLSQFGKVIELNMIYRNKRFTGGAYVKFSDLKVQNDLLKKNNYYTLKGRKIGIREKIEKVPSVTDIAKTCWFCFTNPNIEKNLILKSYQNFYLAYPKGPIENMHFLILPKKHIQSFIEMDQTMKNEFEEILSSIEKFITINDLDFFIYEKNLPYDNISARHMCVNIVGVDREIMFKYNSKAKKFLEKSKISFIESYDEKFINTINKGEYYQYINGSTGIKLGKTEKRLIYYINIKESQKDFEDYGRWLICYLLEKEERLNWKKCEIDSNFLNILKDKINKYYID